MSPDNFEHRTSNTERLFTGRRRQWLVPPKAAREAMAALGDLPPLVAHLLLRRGIGTAEEAATFMSVDASLLEDPGGLPGIDAAVERIALARGRGERVVVYGDFDADGVTGTALMVRALRRYGLDVSAYIPHRTAEGHGLNHGAIDALRERGASLIVTVDCGATDLDAVAYAKAAGIDTIVTDHHVVRGELPHAVALINPKAPGSQYAFDHLTGVGMALKVAQRLLEPVEGAGWERDLIGLAAIGTITDMAPLLSENRYIVHRGLADLRRTESPGLRALMRAARVDAAHLSAEGIGFGIGPRLNAAGRMDHADLAYELLMTDDPERADALAAEVGALNERRQALTDETLLACQAAIGLRPAGAPLLFAGDAAFHAGVVGLVAGRLAEEFGVPAVVYTVDGDRILASCRSGPDFHWARALEACEAVLLRYGGHAQAAGFACLPEVLPELEARLQAIAGEGGLGQTPTLPGEESPPMRHRGVSVDAEVRLSTVMGRTLQVIQQMEPFGIGNPAPLYLTRDIRVGRVSTMGADDRHLRLSLRSDGAVWDAVAFKQEWLGGTTQIDAVYTVDIDHWNGRPRLRLTIQDYAPSAVRAG